MTREIGISQRVSFVGPVALAIGEILQDSGNRILLSILRQPDAGRQRRTVFQRDQGVLDDPHSSGESRDNHGGPLLMRRFAGLPRHRKTIAGEDAVSRDVLIHQAEDQGIKAVRPGAGRDDHNQHKGIKRLR